MEPLKDPARIFIIRGPSDDSLAPQGKPISRHVWCHRNSRTGPGVSRPA